MATLSRLQECLSVLRAKLASLETRGVCYQGSTSPKTPEANAVHSLPSFESFGLELDRQLSSRGLTEQLRHRIGEWYLCQCDIWRQKVLAVARDLEYRIVSLDRERPVSLMSSLRDAHAARYVRGLSCLQMDVLSAIDARVSRYRQDSVATPSCSSDYLTESDDNNVRGHGAEAVAILEAAYAYTTNITQAEKRRLAQVTGLEPRQVVIWFQNRRNRKVKSKLEDLATKAMPTQAIPIKAKIHPNVDPSPPARKRRASSHDDGHPCHPQTPTSALKKPRFENMPPPPPLDRRIFSGNSSSSIVSSVDSPPSSTYRSWTRPLRVGKERNVSSDSTLSSYTNPSSVDSVLSASSSSRRTYHPTQQMPWTSQSAHCNQAPTPSQQHEGNLHEESLQSCGRSLVWDTTKSPARQPPPAELAHIFTPAVSQLEISCIPQPTPEPYVFTEESDIPQLDFDDLELDLDSIGTDLTVPFDLTALPPTGTCQVWRRRSAGDGTSKVVPVGCTPLTATTNGIAMLPEPATHNDLPQNSPRPIHFTEIAEALNDEELDLSEALAALPTLQSMTSDAIIQVTTKGDLRPQTEQFAQCSSTIETSDDYSATAKGKHSVTPPSQATDAMSPEEYAFSFDFAQLGLSRTFAEVRRSYRWADEEARTYHISEAEEEDCGGEASGWDSCSEDQAKGTEQQPASSSDRLNYLAASFYAWSPDVGPPDWNIQRPASGAREGVSTAS